MKSTRIQTPAQRLGEIADDLALETLVAIEAAWKGAHPGGEPEPDRWGEGPSHMTLAALGLDVTLYGFTLVGICPRHGDFLSEWWGRHADRPPEHARCPVVADGKRCELDGLVTPVPMNDKAA